MVLAGSNAPSNHPRLMNELIKLRDRGGTHHRPQPPSEKSGLVKFWLSPSFPVKSLIPGSPIANLFLQPLPGSDLAIFLGIQKSLIERDLVDYDFLKAHTDNWEAVIEQAKQTDWDTLVTTCSVSKSEIEQAATLISNAKRVVFAWAMGLTHQINGVDNVCGISKHRPAYGQTSAKMGTGVMPVSRPFQRAGLRLHGA